MKLLVLLAVLASARPVAANVACNNNFGLAPRTGTTLPKHPRLVIYDTRGLEQKVTASLAGKPVKLGFTKVAGTAPYDVQTIEVQSDATGLLQIWDNAGDELARYPISGGAKLPADVSGTARHFEHKLRHSTVREVYDALAIDIGDATPAVLATVKIRRDAQADWKTLVMPVTPGDWMDKRTSIRVGALGCESNYSVPLLANGVDIAVTVMLADGSARPVKLPAHVKL